jgi:hypothetical protein
MKNIAELEAQLAVAKNRNLIRHYEHIVGRDYILVVLHETTSDMLIQKLKVHLRDTYKQIHFVTTGAKPNSNHLYIKYSVE